MAAVIITSALITGTLLAPIKSYARSNNNSPRSPGDTTNDGSFFDSRSLKQATHDEIRADLKNNNQSINQENLCSRSNTCRQSEIGQDTLGNDNQVTGFADQSDNIRQSATANKTTPTTTLRTATLTVIIIVSGRDLPKPSSFTMHVTGNNPTPANFAGSAAGVNVTLDPGLLA